MDENALLSEVYYEISHSSGAGGQNVNKVATKVALCFNVNQSKVLTDAEKLLVTEKACNKINQTGILRVVSQTERSQYQNKLKATEKILNLIKKALTPVVKRVPTTNSEASINKRLHQKKIHSEKKILRKNITE